MNKPLFPYQQVREYILEQIRNGVWKPGENLPSEVNLAAKLEVHRLTVNRVMRELAQSGEVQRRRGVGTMVSHPSTKNERTPFGEGLIGLICGHHFDPLTNPYYSEIFESLRRGLQKEDFFLMPLGDVLEFLELISSNAGNGLKSSISALALLGPVDDKVQMLLTALNFPMTVVGVTEYKGPFPSVASDDQKDVAVIAKNLFALGHKKIVHLNAESPQRLCSRLEGFLSNCEAEGFPLPYRYVIEAKGLEIEDGREAMHEFLSRGLPFSAVFGGNDNLANGAILALQECGARVPEDVSVVGFDGLGMSAIQFPSLATMQVPRREIGQRAAECLIEVCRGTQPLENHIRISSNWFQGESLSACVNSSWAPPQSILHPTAP